MTESSKQYSNSDLGLDLGLDPNCYLFLRGDPDQRTQNPFLRRLGPICGVVFGVGGAFISNWLGGRPYLTNLPRTAMYGAIGVGLGVYLQRKRMEVTRQNDLMIYHYMTQHPEDFRPKERVLYRDYLRAWVPIR